MSHRANRPCGCHKGQTLAGVPARQAASQRTVLVVDAAGHRERVSAELAARLVRVDPGARVHRAHRDGTLGSAGEDTVMLSGLFSSIGKLVGGAAKGVGSVATGAFKVGKSVVATVAPIGGAAAGFVVGGPAGAAAGAQIGSLVKSTIRPSDRERVERKAVQIAERFALAGVQISGEQAVALAQMTDAQVEQQLAAARAQQTATAQAGVGQQIYNPGASMTATPPPVQQPTPPAAQSVGGIPMPFLLGGAALAAVVLLKK